MFGFAQFPWNVCVKRFLHLPALTKLIMDGPFFTCPKRIIIIRKYNLPGFPIFTHVCFNNSFCFNYWPYITVIVKLFCLLSIRYTLYNYILVNVFHCYFSYTPDRICSISSHKTCGCKGHYPEQDHTNDIHLYSQHLQNIRTSQVMEKW